MTQIHLVRHGQTNWNLDRRCQGQTNSILTELGQQQAREAGQKLKDIAFNHAYSSSSTRAMHTAELILEHHGIELKPHDDLREIQLGHWEGQLYDDIQKQDPNNYEYFWNDPSQFNVSGAETFEELQARAVNMFEQLVAKHPGETILVVSHGAFIKSWLAHCEGRHLRDLWQPPQMSNCSHSIIVYQDDGSFLIQQYANLNEW